MNFVLNNAQKVLVEVLTIALTLHDCFVAILMKYVLPMDGTCIVIQVYANNLPWGSSS